MNEFQYIGQYHDGTGLSHFGARYYDPTLGRFTQTDPTSQDTNLYAYAADNPVNYIDPDGQCGFGSFSDFSNCFTKTIPHAFTSMFSGSYDCFVDAGLGVGGGLLSIGSGIFGIVTSPTGVGVAIGYGGVTLGAAGVATGANGIANGSCG